MQDADVVALVAVLGLGAAHLLPPVLHLVHHVPRSRLLSAAGGTSVAYVFVHLLPEVAEAQQHVDEQAVGLIAGLERHAWVVALVGMVLFYGLHRAALPAGGDRDGSGNRDPDPSPAAFWLSVASFGVYNAIVGYLVVQRAEHDDLVAVALFTVALGLHFFVTDLGLRHHHRRRYDRMGRPLLVAALAVGWILGVATEVSDAALGLAVAFLGGGIVLNVMKEELPEERSSHFASFAGAAGVYAAVLLLA